MGFFCIHFSWNETETLSYPEDMGIDGKRLPSQAKKKEAVNRLRANPLEAPQGLLNLLVAHLF